MPLSPAESGGDRPIPSEWMSAIVRQVPTVRIGGMAPPIRLPHSHLLSLSLATLLVLVAVPAVAAPAVDGSERMQVADQHSDDLNLSVQVSGTQVTGGERIMRTNDPEIRIDASSSERIQDVVIRVDEDRRKAFHPNDTAFEKTTKVGVLNRWMNLTVVARTNKGTVEQVTVEYLKDNHPPQLKKRKLDILRGAAGESTPENDDLDDETVIDYTSPDNRTNFIVRNSEATFTECFFDVSGVEQVQLKRSYYFPHGQIFEDAFSFSSSLDDRSDTFNFEGSEVEDDCVTQRMFFAPSHGIENDGYSDGGDTITITNTIAIDAWDKLNNHRRWGAWRGSRVRVDDDRSPNASRPFTSGFEFANARGQTYLDIQCSDEDDYFDNTTKDGYFTNKTDDFPSCLGSPGSLPHRDQPGVGDIVYDSSLKNWLVNRPDDEIATTRGGKVRLTGVVEDEVMIKEVKYRVRATNVSGGLNCGAISDHLNELEPADFNLDPEGVKIVDERTDAEDLPFGNMNCDDLPDPVLHGLERHMFENVSDSDWEQFKSENRHLVHVAGGFDDNGNLQRVEAITAAETGQIGPEYKEMRVDRTIPLKTLPDRGVKNVVNVTVLDWAGHRTKVSGVIEARPPRVAPVVTLDHRRMGPQQVRIVGDVSQGEVNAVSVETVNQSTGELLSHADVYDGPNTNETIPIDVTLPRERGPTTVVVRTNDSSGETHLTTLNLPAWSEDPPTPGTPSSPPEVTVSTPPTITPPVSQATETAPAPTDETTAQTTGTANESTREVGIAEDITALAGPGFGPVAALAAVIASAALLHRRRE